MQMALSWVVLGLALGNIQAESLPDNMEALPGLVRVETGILYVIEEYIQVKYSLEPLERFKRDIENELSNREQITMVIKETPRYPTNTRRYSRMQTRNIVSLTKWHPAYNIRKKRG